MKKIIYFTSLLMSCFIFCDCSKNDCTSGFNPEVVLTDEAFHAWCLSSFDLNGDGILTVNETMVVTRMEIPADFNSVPIRSVKGLEYFGNLQYLEFVANKNIESNLEIRNLSQLREIRCKNLGLETLKITACPLVKILNCGNNFLEKLDLGNLDSLAYLDCVENDLAALCLSGKEKLRYLDCTNNFRMKSLDVSNCIELSQLTLKSCSVNNLNIQNCINLYQLECGLNNLTELDANTCSNLKILECYSNDLHTIRISQLRELEYVDFSNNDISILFMTASPNIQEIYSRQNNFLVSIYLSREIDIDHMTNANGKKIKTDITTDTIFKHYL